MRSAQLGGNREGTAIPGGPFAFGTVNRAYQDEQTRQWFLEVKLEGGRLVRGVMVMSQGDGAASGARGRLPADGARGVVAYPGFPRSTGRAVWLGSLDAYFFGVDVDSRDASVNVHPSGAATALDERGASTRRFVGGDTLYVGPEGENPHAFAVRSGSYADTGERLGLDDLDDGTQGPLEVLLSGWRKVRRVVVKLFRDRGELTIDTRSGRAALRAEVHTPDEGGDWRRAQFVATAGQGVRAEVDVSAGQRAGMSASILDDTARASLVEKGSEYHSEVSLDGDEVRVDADITRVGRLDARLDDLAVAPLTEENFRTLQAAVTLLRSRADKSTVQMSMLLKMLPTLWPPLAPVATLASIPLGAPDPETLYAVGSPSIEAEVPKRRKL